MLRIKLLTDTAFPPCRADAGAAGYDIRADFGGVGDATIYPAGRMAIPTGVSGTVPEGCYGRIAPRSGLAVSSGIDVLAGVIDRSYTGEWVVILLNTGDKPMRITHGQKIAQLIIERCETPDVEIVADLDATDRGAGGFGSTGSH